MTTPYIPLHLLIVLTLNHTIKESCVWGLDRNGQFGLIFILGSTDYYLNEGEDYCADIDEDQMMSKNILCTLVRSNRLG